MKYLRILTPTLVAACCIMSVTVPVLGQGTDTWPRKFFIGAGHVRCDLLSTDSANTWARYVETVEGQTPGGLPWPAGQFLPLSRFTQLEDLGIDLAEFTIHPNHLPPPGIPHNVVSELNAAAVARTAVHPLDLCLFDFPLRSATASERIMLHPEYVGDFENSGSYQAIDQPQFENYPAADLALDHQIGQHSAGAPNCVRMGVPGTISGLSLLRMQDLSVHRRYMTVQGRQHDSSAGKYHLLPWMRS